MGFDPDWEPPSFFCKPDNSIVVAPPGKTVSLSYPSRSADFQHEIELVIAIGRAGRDIPVQQAEEHIFGHAVGVDMTPQAVDPAAHGLPTLDLADAFWSSGVDPR